MSGCRRAAAPASSPGGTSPPAAAAFRRYTCSIGWSCEAETSSIPPVSILRRELLRGEAQHLKFGHAVQQIPVPCQRVKWEHIPIEVVLKIEDTREPGSGEGG